MEVANFGAAMDTLIDQNETLHAVVLKYRVEKPMYIYLVALDEGDNLWGMFYPCGC